MLTISAQTEKQPVALMTDSSSSPHYEKHDFSAVNAYVDGVSDAVFERARSARAARFATYAKYSALVIAALGLMALLVLWGLSFLKEPRVVTETKIVEKPVSFEPNIYITNPSVLDQTRNSAEQRVRESASEAGVSAEVFDFVIFREFPFGENGFSDVVVGMRYANNEDRTPSSQWCYVERNTSDVVAHTEKITLANKEGNQVVMTPINDQHARELGARLPTIRRAQNLCQFR
jgi:hypothetical protein